ncbi:hypothetical protein [Nostoc sp. NMS8]|uniref:hypothetical protein n=1 Tax=Nostoc sp. NMS8 TaxID=2815392 RepID=UPI0025F876E7|nr:hypothetical protein [Nostoc sp. NMS8]MBN3959216.1 hypothetical protein [Nostoc sp. NMS8]
MFVQKICAIASLVVLLMSCECDISRLGINIQNIIKTYQLKLITYQPVTEDIVEWIT